MTPKRGIRQKGKLLRFRVSSAQWISTRVQRTSSRVQWNSSRVGEWISQEWSSQVLPKIRWDVSRRVSCKHIHSPTSRKVGGG